MINSKYISDIMELLLDGDNEGTSVKPQLEFLTEAKLDYTSSGLFIYFNHDDKIYQFKYAKPNLVLVGVKITTTELPIEADATIFLKDGIIDYLEIFCYQGNYPKRDLKSYTLTQAWNGSPGKQIKRNE